MKASLEPLLASLPKAANESWPNGVPFTGALAHGSMTVEVFAPRGTDHQQPHDQDELYFVMSGRSDFIFKGERMTAAAGDVLFVPAHAPHHFENMTDDFATWVVFWGPDGGEGS